MLWKNNWLKNLSIFEKFDWLDSGLMGKGQKKKKSIWTLQLESLWAKGEILKLFWLSKKFKLDSHSRFFNPHLILPIPHFTSNTVSLTSLSHSCRFHGNRKTCGPLSPSPAHAALAQFLMAVVPTPGREIRHRLLVLFPFFLTFFFKFYFLSFILF